MLVVLSLSSYKCIEAANFIADIQYSLTASELKLRFDNFPIILVNLRISSCWFLLGLK